MAKWEVLSAEEEETIRRMGKEPGPMMVNRVGESSRVFLNLITREEIYVVGASAPRTNKNGGYI